METKQVIVVRTRFPDGEGGTRKIRKGKLAAQASHASMKVFFDRGDVFDSSTSGGELRINLTEAMRHWTDNAFAKIVVGAESEDELVEIYEKAKAAGLPTSFIVDAGRTEFHGEATKTAVAVGPAEVEDVDEITGHLKLL